MYKNSIIIVDDHNLFRKGLGLILNETPNLEVIAEASDGIEFLELLPNLKPDIVLMDIDMPRLNGIEATKKALSLYPNLKIIALSTFEDYENYQLMIDAGVVGFIIKKSDSSELITGIQKALAGDNYFSQQLLQNIAHSIATMKSKMESEGNISKRELEVLEHICKGMTNQEIGELLFVHPRTIERHRASLLQKTDSKNSISLVLFAVKNGLVKL